MNRLTVVSSPPLYRALAIPMQVENTATISTLLITHARFGWRWDFPPVDATDHEPTDRALAQDFRDLMLLPTPELQLFWIADQVEKSSGTAFAGYWQGADVSAYRVVLRRWWLQINADSNK